MSLQYYLNSIANCTHVGSKVRVWTAEELFPSANIRREVVAGNLQINVSRLREEMFVTAKGADLGYKDIYPSGDTYTQYRFTCKGGWVTIRAVREDDNDVEIRLITDKYNLDMDTSFGYESQIGTLSSSVILQTISQPYFIMRDTYNGVKYIGVATVTDARIASGTFIATLQSYDNVFGSDDAELDFDIIDDIYGPYSEPGGYGGYKDLTSDIIGLPKLPSVGISNSGMVNVYKIGTDDLRGFVNDLFPDIVIPAPSLEEGIEAVAENLANTVSTIGQFAECFINQNLTNYILDTHIIPCAPQTTDSVGIKVGFKDFEYNPLRVVNDYVEVDCGTVNISTLYDNFLDTKAEISLYLPFVGYVKTDIDYCLNGYLRVIYHFNVIDGSFMAYLLGYTSLTQLNNPTVVGTYSGNCCMHVPITGMSYASTISGVVGAISKVSSGNVVGGVGGLLSDTKPSIEQSNGYNSSTAYMSYRTPYLIIKRPKANISSDYYNEYGLPSNITAKVSTLRGYTELDNPILDNLNCKDDERELLRQILTSGFII